MLQSKASTAVYLVQKVSIAIIQPIGQLFALMDIILMLASTGALSALLVWNVKARRNPL